MKGRRWLKDVLAIISIILIGTGIGLMVIRRARSWELGIVLLVLGAIMFYIRYFSNIIKDEPKIKIIDADYKIK